MKRNAIFLIFVLAASLSWAQTGTVKPQGYVTDQARVLTPASRRTIEAFCLELENKTGIQLAVVTVPSVRPDTTEQYAVKLFQEWGIGRKGKDDGVLFLTAVRDRDVRIEVGYGLEGFLTDAMTKNILERYVIPAFRQGSFSTGIEAGVTAIVSLAAQEHSVAVTGQEARVSQSLRHQEGPEFNLLSLIMMVIMVIVFIRNPRLFFFIMMMSMMGGGRRGSGYGGSFGGGSGGFGGGMSGGGGATGRW